MSCRSTPAGSAATTLARLSLGDDSHVSDPACLSVFHHLRREYDPERDRSYTREDYDRILNSQERQIAYAGLSDARQASLRRRIADARANPPLDADGNLDQGLCHAVTLIGSRLRSVDNNTANFIATAAAELGEPGRTVAERFAEYAASAPRRNRRLLDGFDDAVARTAADRGLGREAGASYAAARITEEIRAVQRARAAAAPRRIGTLTPLSGTSQHTRVDGVRLLEAGYDRRTGRLEVVTSDGVRRTYHNVSQRGWTQAVDDHLEGRFWAENVRGNSAHAYNDEHEALMDGVAPRCPTCGQYADTSHTCPIPAQPRRINRWTTTSRWSRQPITITAPNDDGEEVEVNNRVSMPAIREFRAMVNDGPVEVPISEYIRGAATSTDSYWGNSSRVWGNVTAWREEDGTLHVSDAGLQCYCAAYRAQHHCEHVDAVAAAVRTRLDPPPRTPAAARTPEERAAMIAEQQRRAEEAARTDWTRNEETLAEARRTWQENAEVSYSENAAAFVTDYEDALATWAKDGDGAKVPYMTENAMDGMAAPGSGQAFGMEIEFEFGPDVNRYQARQQIGRELYEAGLTYSAAQQGYGASKRRGFRDSHKDENGVGNWSYESDCSVNGGEIVTPGMYDTAETWQNIQKVCEILQRNGAVATKKAGMHVHVGTKSYEGDPKKYTELARMVTQHEDVLYRAAANPHRGTHRGARWAGPNQPVPQDGFSEVRDGHRWQAGRYKALNYGGVNGSSSDHPEFRVFDSSLDPGTMQMQAKMAVGMVNASARVAGDGGTKRGMEELGAHAKRRGRSRRRLTSEELLADTATARSFVDTVFRRRSDKRQFLAVFAKNTWAKASRS